MAWQGRGNIKTLLFAFCKNSGHSRWFHLEGSLRYDIRYIIKIFRFNKKIYNAISSDNKTNRLKKQIVRAEKLFESLK
jgi:hypothetical protein